MAVKLTNTSQGNVKQLAPAYSDIVIEAEGIPANILGLYNVKYIMYLIINNFGVMIKLKAPLDSNNKALFRISSILQDYTQSDKRGYDIDNIYSRHQGNQMLYNNHSVHTIDEFCRNRSNLNSCLALGAYEYSTTPSGNIIEAEGSLNTDVSFLFFNSVAQHKDGYSSQDFSDYLLNANTKKFLSVFSSEQNIQMGQYHTVGFLNGEHHEVSQVSKIQIRAYDINDDLVDTLLVDNTDLNGGAVYPQDLYAIDGAVSPPTPRTNKGLLYFGCGTKNLTNTGFNFQNATYYIVTAVHAGSAVSQGYRFNIVGADCKGYETIRLAFLNSLGAWDYYNFTKKSTRITQINKSVMKQNYGEIPAYSTTNIGDILDASYYNQGTYDGGTRVFNVNATETIEANTDFVNEEEAAILEELFLSPDVYMQTGDIFEPVVIDETEYVKQTSANDMLKQYIITIEKGHNKRVQRL